MTKAIIAKNVAKKYKVYDSQKERILDLVTPQTRGKQFYALNGVNFEAEKGDVVGFIGINGSGKSTLSNILAGIVPETEGDVQVNGKTALIAVAAGLSEDLTGRDNIELKCLMLGFSKDEIKALEPDIIEFSELENFIDMPVKSYSSGMKSRLGFAISVNIDPDVLIIDEALSVGDKAFAEKSLKKMMEFKDQGKTMIFVSHSVGQMKRFCDKILWLEFGRVKAFGEVKDVLPLYEGFLTKWRSMSKEERADYRQKVMGKDPSEVEYKQFGNLMLLDDDEELERAHGYTIRPVSRLAHLKGDSTFLFETPDSDQNKKNAHKFKRQVYYVKREATYHFENFYLLSTLPSGEDGVIGWIRAEETTSHALTFIDEDMKEFILNDTGFAAAEPWGGPNQYVHETLEHHAGMKFQVDQTVLVGNNVWYRGLIEGEDTSVWTHMDNVTAEETNSL